MNELIDLDLENIENAAKRHPAPFVHQADTLKLVAEVRSLRQTLALIAEKSSDPWARAVAAREGKE